MITFTQRQQPKSLGCLFVSGGTVVLCGLSVPAVGSCANQQKDAGPILLLLLLLRIRRPTQRLLLLPTVRHTTTSLSVWKNSRQSAGRVGERERERKRERKRERDPEPASSSSTPQHLTIYVSLMIWSCAVLHMLL
jgi:hypothetical protein